MATYDNNPSTVAAAGRDEIGAALLSSGARTGGNDGAPTTEGRYMHGAAHVSSSARTAFTRTDGGAGDHYPDARTAADQNEHVTVYIDDDMPAGASTERLRRELPVIGLSLATLAVTGLAASEPTPAAGFGLFLILIVGLSAVTIRALRA